MSPGSRGPERGQVHGQDGSDHLITGHHQDTTPPPDVAQILNDDPLPCLSASRLQKEREKELHFSSRLQNKSNCQISTGNGRRGGALLVHLRLRCNL